MTTFTSAKIVVFRASKRYKIAAIALFLGCQPPIDVFYKLSLVYR